MPKSKSTKKKLEKLTRSQEAEIPAWIEKWKAIGLSTEPADFVAIESAIKRLYVRSNLPEPNLIFRLKSPAGLVLTDLFLREKLASVRDSVMAPVRASVWASVGDSVRDSVMASVGGGFGCDWPAWYEFFSQICGVSLVDIHRDYTTTTTHGGWWLPRQNALLMSDRPKEIHRNTQGRLHAEGRMAIEYRDGWGFWALNGVRVPEWIAVQRAEELDPQQLFKIDNAQIRAEFVRKVGIERLWSKCNPRIADTRGEYQLGYFTVDNREIGPYLKMHNQSVPELWHIEGVPRECNTVQKALNWRGTGDVSKTWKPEILT